MRMYRNDASKSLRCLFIAAIVLCMAMPGKSDSVILANISKTDTTWIRADRAKPAFGPIYEVLFASKTPVTTDLEPFMPSSMPVSQYATAGKPDSIDISAVLSFKDIKVGDVYKAAVGMIDGEGVYQRYSLAGKSYTEADLVVTHKKSIPLIKQGCLNAQELQFIAGDSGNKNLKSIVYCIKTSTVEYMDLAAGETFKQSAISGKLQSLDKVALRRFQTVSEDSGIHYTFAEPKNIMDKDIESNVKHNALIIIVKTNPVDATYKESIVDLYDALAKLEISLPDLRLEEFSVFSNTYYVQTKEYLVSISGTFTDTTSQKLHIFCRMSSQDYTIRNCARYQNPGYVRIIESSVVSSTIDQDTVTTELKVIYKTDLSNYVKLLKLTEKPGSQDQPRLDDSRVAIEYFTSAIAHQQYTNIWIESPTQGIQRFATASSPSSKVADTIFYECQFDRDIDAITLYRSDVMQVFSASSSGDVKHAVVAILKDGTIQYYDLINAAYLRNIKDINKEETVGYYASKYKREDTGGLSVKSDIWKSQLSFVDLKQGITHQVTTGDLPRRLRYSDDLVIGDFYTVKVNTTLDNGDTKVYSSIVQRLVYMNKTEDGELAELYKDSQNSLLGTRDMLYHLAEATLHSCRPFATILKDEVSHILCSKGKKLGDSMNKTSVALISSHIIENWIFLMYSVNDDKGKTSINLRIIDTLNSIVSHRSLISDTTIEQLTTIEAAILPVVASDAVYCIASMAVDGKSMLQAYFMSISDKSASVSVVTLASNGIASYSATYEDFMSRDTQQQGKKVACDVSIVAKYGSYSVRHRMKNGSILDVKSFHTLQPIPDKDSFVGHFELKDDIIMINGNHVSLVNQTSGEQVTVYRTTDDAKIGKFKIVEGRVGLLLTEDMKMMSVARGTDNWQADRYRRNRQLVVNVDGINNSETYYEHGSMYFRDRKNGGISYFSYCPRSYYLAAPAKSRHVGEKVTFTATLSSNPASNLIITQSLLIREPSRAFDFTSGSTTAQYGDLQTIEKIRHVFNDSLVHGHFWRIRGPPGYEAVDRLVRQQTKAIDEMLDCESMAVGDNVSLCVKDQSVAVAVDNGARYVGKIDLEKEFEKALVEDIVGLNQIANSDGSFSAVLRLNAGRQDRLALLQILINKDGVPELSFVQKDIVTPLQPEDIDIKVIWTAAGPVIGVTRTTKFERLSLINAKTGKVLYEVDYVENYDIFYTTEHELGGYLFLARAVANSDAITFERILIEDASVYHLKAISLGYAYDKLRCAFRPAQAKPSPSCLFVGSSISWWNFNLKDNKELNIITEKTYMAYENMEAEAIEMWFDNKGESEGFLVKGSRINPNVSVTHDSSGVMYYRSFENGGTGWMSGGLTNEDLLDLGIRTKFIIEWTSQRTLNLRTPLHSFVFNLSQPEISGSKIPLETFKKGIDLTVIGSESIKATVDTKGVNISGKKTSVSAKQFWIYILIIAGAVTVVLILYVALCYAFRTRKAMFTDKTFYEGVDGDGEESQSEHKTFNDSKL